MRRCVAPLWLPYRGIVREWCGSCGCVATSRRWCQSLRLPSVEFAAPRSQTHEDLAYASCPICGRLMHMCDMFTHLTTAHRELNREHCNKICSARLELYQKVIGVPLKKIELTTSGRRVLDLLPTVLPSGYICNWCDKKDDVYPTRDKFLRHVADVHAEIDLEDIEQHVPLLPRGVAEEKSSVLEGMWPTRRLSGAEAVAETFTLPSTARRQTAVSIPRVIDKRVAEQPGVFSDTEFPCELCSRVFQSEMDLLQHLETRHPDGTAEGSADVDHSAIADVAEFTAKEATMGGSQRVHVICDLCPSSSKVYTMPSALFSHIRFKHPGEDAAYHVERLIRTQKGQSFVCKVCSKAFATADALEGHFRNKHTESASAPVGQGRVATTNCWWCHDCEKGFSSAKGLHGHMQNKHGLSSQIHPCPACKRVFTDVYSLEEHITLMHKTIHLHDIGLQTHAKCATCERYFLSYEDLHRHAVKHHKKDPRAPIRPFEATASSSTPRNKGTAASDAPSSASAPRKVKKRKKSGADEESSK
ncbi:Zn-finger protein [Trypanosoma rangeli SC58]|uniref:Zn-finger protein n=1 Tax=Trypanosoma rangeli SC58 TaxID=429131 RepID=A0A061J310_TRYRA|nr:Zn-finger protein [Trypanosoma rangeli SC58]